MADATKLATQAGGADPSVGLRAVAALRRLLEHLEAVQVRNARARNWSWQDIASALGVSRQAVHKKYAGRFRQVEPLPADGPEGSYVAGGKADTSRGGQ